jgi:hypothetical protein
MNETIKASKCPLCESELRQLSKVCPHCGNRIRRWDRFLHNYFIQIFVGALIGVISYHYGQKFEQERQEKITIERQNKINDHAIILLKIELSQNMATLNNVEILTKKNLSDLDENKVTITPLMHFSFETWDYVKFSEADFLFISDTADLRKLINCYLVLRILENKIKDREQYRLFNEGSTNFKERLASLDHNILNYTETAREHIEDAQEYLDRIHAWKVKGRSFHQLPDGRIETLTDEKSGR